MRYRRDISKTQPDGSVAWYARWMGGPTLAAVTNCRVEGIDRRYTVEITGYADTWFSVPAVTRIRGRRITGYVTHDDTSSILFVPHSRYLPLVAP